MFFAWKEEYMPQTEDQQEAFEAAIDAALLEERLEKAFCNAIQQHQRKRDVEMIEKLCTILLPFVLLSYFVVVKRLHMHIF